LITGIDLDPLLKNGSLSPVCNHPNTQQMHRELLRMHIGLLTLNAGLSDEVSSSKSGGMSKSSSSYGLNLPQQQLQQQQQHRQQQQPVSITAVTIRACINASYTTNVAERY